MNEYSAKKSYQNGSDIGDYQKLRFSGFLGRYRYEREQNAIKKILSNIGNNVTIADCPCGNGRWWPLLSKKASKIIGIDISYGMLQYALSYSKNFSSDIQIKMGDAENLPLNDNSVDYVFSHALTKHLPIPLQYSVLAEFARVAKRGVICSFGIFTHTTYEFWRVRRLSESYPTFIEELQWMSKFARLKINQMHRCTTIFGVEHTVFFEKEIS